MSSYEFELGQMWMRHGREAKELDLKQLAERIALMRKHGLEPEKNLSRPVFAFVEREGLL